MSTAVEVGAVTLRRMRWTDIPALVAAESALFATDAWSAPTWWAELAGRPRRDYLVATRGEQLCGYAGVDLAGDVADVMTVAVLTSAQGGGVGSALLTELQRRAAAAGAQYLMLEVRSDNDAAIALYRRFGFEVLRVRPRYYQPGDVDALVMRAPLTSSGRVQ